ncbi:hypothetical protein FE784_34375 [Paenibacillus hemerocallicola]|uniref:Uncharacterized protein n=1 Tax=Paenibacillus hemerocallicola TaxID=1172614 RepID=A0A5C4SYZ0_9BACL|nr:hypothetical protein [Paenibacillus hemerocallicola]TNJ61361.1 hypothetical protein FE784_34375 [Paenibacillus hemerocallicola]
MRRWIVMLLAVLLMTPSFTGASVHAVEQGTGGEIVTTGEEALYYYLIPNNFKTFGTWRIEGQNLLGRTTGSTAGALPAIAEVDIVQTGDYKLWVRDRDFAINAPGTRTFQVAVDGTTVNKTFGTHGQDGFRWTEVGTFTLSAGTHDLALEDTSATYARSEGFFLTDDLNLVPPEDKNDLLAIVQPDDPLASIPPAAFPAWAEANVTPVKTDSIENDSVKVVFHQGVGTEGSLVQNEIFVKAGGQWVPVKNKTEQFGFLMMAALRTELIGTKDQYSQLLQRVTVDGKAGSYITDDFFRSGIPVWFIPTDYTKVSAGKVQLSFANTEADLTVTFELDALADDPKVTLNAEFPQAGAYSFLLFSGNGVDYEDYETVTAPLLYVKKAVPERAVMYPESFLFTPMATLHFPQGGIKAQGRELTAGVALDPTSVPQGYFYPETSAYGLVLRDQGGQVRPQLIAPMYGSPASLFASGSDYEVSYRIVNRLGSWYDTFKHVTENMYNLRDLRTNAFHSINEALYNATDLMMDDDYGGWDSVNMAHYNMEEKEMTTMANAMSAVQRYLLTEDESILDERAIPTLAFMLSRQNYHFKITTNKGGSSYPAVLPSPLGGPVKNYSASVFGGLYEMTQGRMPFLMDTAIDQASQNANLGGVTDQAALYKYTGDEDYLAMVRDLADQYLTNHPNAGANRESQYVSGFVFGDYIPMVMTFLAAYEATGDPKYLDAARENASLLVTGLWTTGYHDGYATSNYTIDPVETAERMQVVEQFIRWWHGERQWRLGNVDGEAKPPQLSGPPLVEETVPGWLLAKAGMGTEHWRTPGHGNIITMNNWAGMLVKLSEYTGDPFFEKMSRNATVGRYGNYAGYYQDRMIVHQMRDDYPYVGPDYTQIYWHHIPSFISMLEDFLINSVWTKSERNIAFPSIYQSGYAFLASNQFGHAPGTFYGEEDMWLWLDRGIIEPDTTNVDYIAARKDGKLGLALMNEDNAAITTVIALGDKVSGGATYSGSATVYEADGTMSTLAVVDGRFTIAIPPKGIRSLVLDIPDVAAPGYAKTDYSYSNHPRSTVTGHTRGKGHVIQISPDSYHAFVYINDLNATTSKLTMQYQIGGQSFTAEKAGYPYEFLIKVDDPMKKFTYQLTATKVGGATENLGGGTLEPYQFQDSAIAIPEQGRFEPIGLTVLSTGTATGEVRLVVSGNDFPFPLSENLLNGLKITGILTHKTNGATLALDSLIIRNEMRSNGNTVLAVSPTAAVPVADYKDYNIQLTIHPRPKLGYFEPLAMNVNSPGTGQGNIRLVVSNSNFPFPLTGNVLTGLRITGTLTHKTTAATLNLDSRIAGNEVRTNGTTVLVVHPTTAVSLADYKDYNISITIHPLASPPVTSAHVAPVGEAGENGWHTGPVNVSFAVYGSSVTETVYRLNGGAWNAYNQPFQLADDGVHTLDYYSVTYATYAEPIRSSVIRIDATAPTLSLTASPSTIWPPDGRMVPITTTPEAADGGSGVATLTLVSITSNEPDEGTGPASIQGASYGTDDREYSLLAERADTGSGRTYTIVYTVKDLAGNATTASVDVHVPLHSS